MSAKNAAPGLMATRFADFSLKSNLARHMDPTSPLDPNAELRELAYERLDEVTKSLKAAQKALRRDWESLTPGERSAQSRVVKDFEKQIAAIEEEIEMYRPLVR